jgi:hypothetical protein
MFIIRNYINAYQQTIYSYKQNVNYIRTIQTHQ